MTRKLHRLVLLFIAPSRLLGSGGRIAVLRWCGLSVGPEVIMSPGVQFLCEDVSIGQAAFINRSCRAGVTQDWEPDGLYGGMPARRIRDLPVGAP